MAFCPGFRKVWALLMVAAAPGLARGQASAPVRPSPQAGVGGTGGMLATPLVSSMRQLVAMGPQELDALYRRGVVPPVPVGRVQGRLIYRPGTGWAVPASRAARLVWQGKVFSGDEPTAVNRFFGLRVVRADVSYGTSWVDGGPALILDYSQTSRVYARYRDEIRQVGPGLYLGVMHERTAPQPTFKTYFALADRR